MTTHKALIQDASMPDDMQQDAVDLASDALDKGHLEKEIAFYIKKEFDKKHGTQWHCIVGRDFGSNVTHEKERFIYFRLGEYDIVLFKAG